MSFTHIYTIPAYYPDFRCKAGSCRHPCCIGWNIAISMEEYFRMIGLDCSPELRRRLDIAFHLADEPSENHYAVVSPRWDGDCPLRMANGLCALQCECGVEAIPSVCRYYPRSPKSRYAYQCQCANSCEAVIELLFARREPMTFLRQRMTFHIAESVPHENDPIPRLFPAVQRACLHILQDRSRPLSLRFKHLGELILVMDIPYRQGNADGIHAVLPFYNVAAKADSDSTALALTRNEQHAVFRYLGQFLHWISENNAKLYQEANSAIQLLSLQDPTNITPKTLHAWAQYTCALQNDFPENDRMLEQVFVNHLCYNGFPFSADHRSLWDSYLAFATAYALVRVFSVCHLAEHAKQLTTQEARLAAYVDAVAAVFRLIEHTSFDHNAAVLARRFDFDRSEQILLLCYV